MSRFLARPFAAMAVVSVAAVAVCGCVAPYPGEGYGYGNVPVGAGYYERYGFDYGGWGPGYYVGPGPRGGNRFFARGGGQHAFRGPPAGRGMPSLPRGGRGGGRAGGGGHGGGGGRR